MTWHEMGLHMVRIFRMSDGIQQAQLDLIRSPFSFSVRRVWLNVYSEGTRTGRVQHIETLPIDVKKDLWANTLELCKDLNLTKEQLIEVSKVFYCLETYLNENQCEQDEQTQTRSS